MYKLNIVILKKNFANGKVHSLFYTWIVNKIACVHIKEKLNSRCYCTNDMANERYGID